MMQKICYPSKTSSMLKLSLLKVQQRSVVNHNHATRKFTKTHEWFDCKDHKATIGISSYAQDNIGDLTYASLPSIGEKFLKGEKFCVLESSKAATDVFMPLTSEIVDVNTRLIENPTLINKDPYGEGWLVKVVDYNNNDKETSGYMDYSSYKDYLEKEQ